MITGETQSLQLLYSTYFWIKEVNIIPFYSQNFKILQIRNFVWNCFNPVFITTLDSLFVQVFLKDDFHSELTVSERVVPLYQWEVFLFHCKRCPRLGVSTE